MCIVELISTGDGEIMETQDNIGIKLCVLCSASVSALQIVFSNSLYESTGQMGDFSAYQRGQIVGVHLAGASLTKMAT